MTYQSSSGIVDALRDVVPLNRILLETDAPYMVPDGLSGNISHPGMCLQTADFIAKLKGVPLDDLLKTIRQNTKEMYSI